MKGLVLVAIAVVIVVLGIYIMGRYEALAACTELDHRLDEAAKPPAALVPVSEASATERIKQLGAELRVDVTEIQTAFEPLTPQNANTLSAQAQKAVAIASKLPNYVLSGTILTLHVGGQAKRRWATRTCQFDRRMLIMGQ